VVHVKAVEEAPCQLGVSLFEKSMTESFQTLRQYRLGKEMILVAVLGESLIQWLFMCGIL
jgi:hypothetical protein